MKDEIRNMKYDNPPISPFKKGGVGGIILLLASCFMLLSACGADNTVEGENYGNISAGTLGAVLIEAEHVSGWGKSDCFECHNMENIHQTDRSGTGLNLAAIRQLTKEQGLASCSICHGTNGVQ